MVVRWRRAKEWSWSGREEGVFSKIFFMFWANPELLPQGRAKKYNNKITSQWRVEKDLQNLQVYLSRRDEQHTNYNISNF